MILGIAIALIPLAVLFVAAVAVDGAKTALSDVWPGIAFVSVILVGFLLYH